MNDIPAYAILFPPYIQFNAPLFLLVIIIIIFFLKFFSDPVTMFGKPILMFLPLSRTSK